MHSSDWQYLGYVLVGMGGALSISGSIAIFYLQKNPWTSHQYSSYPIPLLLIGVCIIVLGIVAFLRFKQKRKVETKEGEKLPPPPLPPPPPPPT